MKTTMQHVKKILKMIVSVLNNSKSLYSAVGIMILAAGFNYYFDYTLNKVQKRNVDIRVAIEKISLLEQELANFLYLAVIEHNLNLARRYDSTKTALNTEIKQAIGRSGNRNISKEISSIGEMYNKIAGIADASLALMKEDKWKEARNILFGKEFIEARETYYIDSQIASATVSNEIELIEKKIKIADTIILAVWISSLLLILCVGILFSSRTKADMAEQMRLRREIEASNIDLERRINERTEEIRLYSAEMEEEAKLEATLSNLNARIQAASNASEAAKYSLDTIIDFFKAARGALFVPEAGGRLNRKASYAFPVHIDIPDSFGLNEGTIGKCALKGEPILTVPPDQSFWIQFGIGSVPPVQVLTYPLKSTGALIGVVELCLIEPMTERQEKWLEKTSKYIATALRIAREREEREIAEERIRQILESTDEGIFGMDTEGYVTFVNPSACAMLGYDEENIIGKQFHAMFHYSYGDGTPYPPEECHMSAAFRGEKIHGVDTEVFWRYDGTMIPVEYSATPIYKNNEIIGSVVSFRDITERKRIDAMKVEKEVAEEAAMRAEKARQAMERAQEDLKAKVQEIERFNRLALDREKRIIELKDQINELLAASGKEHIYKSTAEEALIDSVSSRELAEETVSVDRAFAANLQTEHVKALMDNFCNAVNVASAVIDLEGKVLVASRWQRLCTDFHRQNEGTCKRCIESDTELALHLEAGKEYTIYRCKNGLTDAASPIIINDKHVANVFIGQFFSKSPDIAFFEAQAEEFGFNKAEYLAAVDEVPVINEEKLPDILGFLRGFARFVSLLSLEIAAAEASHAKIAQEREAALSLAEDAVQARAQLAEYQDGLERIIAERTEELERRAQELESFNKVMIKRESRVIELKEEINALCEKFGQPVVYPPVWDESTETSMKNGGEA